MKDARDRRLDLVAPIAANLPKLIRDGIERARFIFTNTRRFPELTGASIAGPEVRIRRRRAERRQAISLVTAALVRRLDRRTLRVGDQRDNGLCAGVPIAQLAAHTGMSVRRVGRALRELREAGYITSKQPVIELASPRPRRGRAGVQTHMGLPSVRTVTPLLLRRLGFTERKIGRARKHASDDWARVHAPPASAVAILGTRRALRQLAAGAAVQARPPGMPTAYYAIELGVKAKHPDWPYERVRAEARRLFRPPQPR